MPVAPPATASGPFHHGQTVQEGIDRRSDIRIHRQVMLLGRRVFVGDAD